MADQIRVVPLGAGQDVGRSCIIVTMAGRNIMFDCGMHMGYQDERRFPAFDFIAEPGRINDVIDLVIISHFHLDHCGALPYLTEKVGYTGPIVMTHPTKAICPILLEDYRKITVDRKGETDFFTSRGIAETMARVTPVNLHQTITVAGLQIKPYYAGHVLGAAMFYVAAGEQSVVYTGDYNMTPDRHLGAAWIDSVKPTLLITETTYATTIRDSKRQRERDLLRQVHECVERGGKVLIPVFALGRAQELCILLDTYWERMNLNVPMYFSAGLTEKANYYYKLFINWTNEKIKNTFVRRNMFDFRHIKPFDRSSVNITKPGPMVMFATPGMLHGGMSLEVFRAWCTSELNMCILPGYCVSGTIGSRLLMGERRVEFERGVFVDVKATIRHLSFSAHADAKGIMQLISMAAPKNVMLVHGEKKKMAFLKRRIITEFGLPVFDPPNHVTVTIKVPASIPVDISSALLGGSGGGTGGDGVVTGDSKAHFDATIDDSDDDSDDGDGDDDGDPVGRGGAVAMSSDAPADGADLTDDRDAVSGIASWKRRRISSATTAVTGVLVMVPETDNVRVETAERAAALLELPRHSVTLAASIPLCLDGKDDKIVASLIERCASAIAADFPGCHTAAPGVLAVASVRIEFPASAQGDIDMSWSSADAALGDAVQQIIEQQVALLSAPAPPSGLHDEPVAAFTDCTHEYR